MKLKLLLAALILAAGIAAAAVITPTASAWDYGNLPSGCSKGPTLIDMSGPSYSYKVVCNGVTSGYLHYGSNPYPSPPTDPTFQPNLDAFVNANYTAPVTTTAAPATTSTGTSTTPTPTTTVTQTVTAPTTTTAVTATTTTVAAALPPTASFTTARTGLSVTFTDTSTAVAPAKIATVTWDFGDGANGVGSTVTHVYAASGTFSVREFVTDTNGLGSPASADVTTIGFNQAAGFKEAVSANLGAASTLALGQPLAVYCVSSWGVAKPEQGYGLTILGSHQVNIWATGCRALTVKRGPVALALLVLGHEAAHALGIASEKTADCYSARRTGKLEAALKISDKGYRAANAAYVRKKWGRC